MRTEDRVGIGSRTFCLAGILGLVLLSRDTQIVLGMVLLAMVAFAATYVSVERLVPSVFVVVVESALVGILVGIALPTGLAFLPYLVVVSLIAGISSGVIGTAAVAVAQMATFSVVAATIARAQSALHLYETIAPWLITGLLAGLFGSWLRKSGRLPVAKGTDASYESALRLLSQLRVLTQRLPSGLDLGGMAACLLESVETRFDVAHAAVFVQTDSGLISPLAFSDEAAREGLSPAPPPGTSVSGRLSPLVISPSNSTSHPCDAYFPLRVDGRVIGVVSAQLKATPAGAEVSAFMNELDEQSQRLAAALAFDEVRSAATSEERRRVAREIHDGIAQEIASLGYLVDEIHDAADTEAQRCLVGSLRSELSRVVNELRLSIFDLRSEELAGSGLGAAISDYVRQIGSRSTLTVHLKLNEAPTRLRREVELELLRIAGEAITNARKHSGARNLWVELTVEPPTALLEVRDDGSGRPTARSESYGLRIMKERADRINARLDILTASGPQGHQGTAIRVAVGKQISASTRAREDQYVDAR